MTEQGLGLRERLLSENEREKVTAYLAGTGSYDSVVRKVLHFWKTRHEQIIEDIALLERLEASRTDGKTVKDLPSYKLIIKKLKEELELLETLEARRK